MRALKAIRRALEAVPSRHTRTRNALGTCLAAVLVTSVPMAARAQDRPSPSQPKEKAKDKDLGERLVRKAVTDSDEDVMDAVIRLMNLASRKLEIEFDAGDETQAVQRRITERLGEAIKIAAAQRRPIRSRQRAASGDKRRMPKGSPDPRRKSSSAEAGDAQATTSATATSRGEAGDRGSIDGDLREGRRSWGQLPMRQREEVIQGATERFLERYRDWIEQYYRALQESDE